MNKGQIVKDIILIPRNFYARGDTTMYDLLKESGYFEVNNEIQLSDIEKVLQEHNEYIEDWLDLSENKRTDSGWYFKRIQSGEYTVGYAFQNKNTDSINYRDMVKACAFFIKSEIEDIRKG